MNKKQFKSIYKLIYVILFVAICALPALLMPFVKSDGGAEKRELSEFPSVIKKDGGLNFEFTSQLETYVSEHFAFRSGLVSLNSMLKSGIFRTSSNEKVIVGKDGWLFFNETLPDYTGNGAPDENALRRVVKSLSLMNEYADDSGMNFIFVPAPNKNTVYGEYMPSRYIKSDFSVLDTLFALIAEDGSIAYADVRGLFTESSELLYHKRDTHWNNKGALTVVNYVLDSIQKSHNDFSKASANIERTWDGDLDSMLFPSLGYKDDQVVYDIDYSYRYLTKYKGPDDISIKTANDNAEGTMYMFRDSFCNSMLPFLAENFASAEFTRSVPYRFDKIEEGTDVIIFEIVERNLTNILLYPPVLPAPVRNVPNLSEEDLPEAEVKAELKFDMLCISSESLCEADSYYVIINGTAYEASPYKDDGFMIYVSGIETLPSGSTVMCIKSSGSENVTTEYSLKIIEN